METNGFEPEETIREDKEKSISVRRWMLYILLILIPGVNVIVLLIWALSEGTHPVQKNWAIAMIIWMIIAVALSFIILFALKINLLF